MRFVCYMSVNHMINRKQKILLIEYFCKEYSFQQKKISLVSAIFPITRIYNFNKIYVGNPQVKLFQLI